MTIGFIGLGLMGRPISLNLHRAGAELIIYNRSRGIVDELVGVGIEAATSPKDVAERAPIIVLMVSDTPAVERVLFGDDGVAQGLQTGAIVIDMGTTAVTATRNFAQQIKAKGAHYVDAPVSGGQVGAEAATLAIMVGASEDAFARAKPIFKVLAKNITHVGEGGAGQV
ncbi:MAG: NAD(P)-dependent oxidoreductase, partial [Proteobacteria bacterium]